MRHIVLAAFLCALFPVVGSVSTANAQVYEDYGFYRFYALRRHNDIQGVEAVFDDYRRNWLKRYNSELLVGADPGDYQSDIPRCTKVDRLDRSRMNRANCGSGHVVRSNLVGYAAFNAGETEETGAIGYFGYEYLVSDNLFLGVGATYGTSQIEHTSSGSTIDATTNDLAIHLLGGYSFENRSMLAWNISYISSTDDITRDNTHTGSFGSSSLLVNGVWYKDFTLQPDLSMSLGIDYTLLIYGNDDFTESTGGLQTVPDVWRGDFTTSLLFTKDLDEAELFARFGTSFEALNMSDQSFDFTADIGGSLSLTNTIALTGSVGGMVRSGGYHEYRGSARIVSKF